MHAFIYGLQLKTLGLGSLVKNDIFTSDWRSPGAVVFSIGPHKYFRFERKVNNKYH